MKRTMNRLLARLAMLCIAIILGAIAVSQAQRGMQAQTAGVGTGQANHPQAMANSGSALPLSAATSTSIPPPIPNDTPSLPLNEASAFKAAPLPEPDLPPPAANEFQANAPAPLAHVAAPANAGEYYQPNYEEESADEFKPATHGDANDSYAEVQASESNFQADAAYGAVSSFPTPPPASLQSENVGRVMKVANDEPIDEPSLNLNANLPMEENSFSDPPSAELPPINEIPVKQPAPNDFAEPAGLMPTEPETRQDFGAERQREPYSAAPEPAFNGFEGRAHMSIQNPPAQRMEPQAPMRSEMNTLASVPPTGDAMRGIGRPGPSELEGIQTPSLTITKSAPQGTQVGKAARFEVVVRNVGSIPANDVVIRDEVPQGTTLQQTEPPAGRSSDGAVVWQLGTIEPGREARVSMEVMPHEEGEIGSVANISFQTSASARTVSTRPQLELEHDGPPDVLVGEDVIFNIKITNPGTGIAHNVRLEEDVPEGLRHFDGRELEYRVGDLKPGEVRLLELKLKADKPGMVNNLLYARADAGLEVADDHQFEVVAPRLEVGVNGPTRRYLERRAAFEIAVANPGTAAARDVNLVARLPRGLRFVDTNNAGHYDSTTHSVRWNLAELPAQEMGTVKLATMPTSIGEQRIRVETSASMGLQANAEHDIVVDGLAALLFTVTDVSDPIEIGGQTTYEVRVMNQGTKPASNLRLDVAIPVGMEAVNGEGPARALVEGNRVAFEPLASLAPQADTFYKIHVRGTSAGDKRVVVRLMSDDVSEPVTKEESTHVYADQ